MIVIIEKNKIIRIRQSYLALKIQFESLD